MVLVDTSVWIGLYRQRDARLGRRMWTLVARNEAAFCGQTWVEFLGGFRSPERRHTFERGLRAFPFVETSRQAFELAAELLAAHPHLGAGDTIIAATAIAADCALFTLDRDFAPLSAAGLRLL